VDQHGQAHDQQPFRALLLLLCQLGAPDPQAADYRRNGSTGKTTTVHIIAAVLEHPAARQTVGAAAHSVRNMNDDTGLPLTVLRYEHWIGSYNVWMVPLLLPRALWLAFFARYPRVLVLEYGAHSGGHLHRLVQVAPPNISVVTTIGPAHLDTLKTSQGVVHEKSAVVHAVPASGLIVLGSGHDYVADLETRAKAQVVKLPGRGVDLARDIARVIALHLGVPKQAIEAALSDFHPVKSLLERTEPRRHDDHRRLLQRQPALDALRAR
jgi:UDP-N-acetylmuramyl pentapeptide synthase